MAWRTPSEDDLCATLSQTEIDAYRRSTGGTDPVGALLLRTSALFRGAIRTGGRARLSPVETEIPESAISKAMDYAAYDMLKRQDREVVQDRRDARRDAEEFMRRLEKGDFEVESWGESESEAVGKSPAQLVSTSPQRVTPLGLEGF